MPQALEFAEIVLDGDWGRVACANRLGQLIDAEAVRERAGSVGR